MSLAALIAIQTYNSNVLLPQPNILPHTVYMMEKLIQLKDPKEYRFKVEKK